MNTQKDLRYGDNCTRCNAASGIDTCPHGGKGCPLVVEPLPANYYEPRPPAEGYAQAHRAQLAKWCVLHKIPAPSGPIVDAFVVAMKANRYGVEETWDAFCWFRHGWECIDRALTAATGSVLSQYAADKIRGAAAKNSQDKTNGV